MKNPFELAWARTDAAGRIQILRECIEDADRKFPRLTHCLSSNEPDQHLCFCSRCYPYTAARMQINAWENMIETLEQRLP